MHEARPDPIPDPSTGREVSAPQAAPEADGHEQPRGTLFLMLLFLILIIGFWTYMYLLMLERS
jgi:hypothetical protein